MSDAIFISYRRRDAAGHAQNLHARLLLWFDSQEVFFDAGSIDAGADFPARIDAAVKSALAVLVVVGPDWYDELTRRIVRPGVDFVRRELELALELERAGGRPVLIPILVGGAEWPDVATLPTSLKTLGPLFNHQAHALHGTQHDWNRQFERLIAALAKLPGMPAPRWRESRATSQPFHTNGHLLSVHFRDPGQRLEALVRSFDSARGSRPARVALIGMPGVGKTHLALKYCLEHRGAYTGVWWFRAQLAELLQLDARTCCEEVGVLVPAGETPARAFARWLDGVPGRWLLVFDNAEDPTGLRELLPGGFGHDVLVTTRNPAWRGLAQVVDMMPWADVDAAEFIVARCPAFTPAQGRRLAELLGGLVLAIEQASAYAEQTDCWPEDLLARLAPSVARVPGVAETVPASGYERSVAAALSLSLRQLSPAATCLLYLASYAAAAPLPEATFLAAPTLCPPALTGAASDPAVWEDVVMELRRVALLERVDPHISNLTPSESDGTSPSLLVHRLTRSVLRAVDAHPELHGPAMHRLLRLALKLDTSLPENWPKLRILVEHAQVAQADAAAPWADAGELLGMLDRQVAFYVRLGLSAEAAAVAASAMARSVEQLGVRDPKSIDRRSTLASCLADVGRIAEARELAEQAHADAAATLGANHVTTAGVAGELATVLMRQGVLSRAIELNRDAHTVFRALKGDDALETLAILNNLGYCHLEAGELPRALGMFEEVLERRTRTLGADHPDNLLARMNIALILENQGQLSAARECLESVLATQRRRHGERHPDTLSTLHNLAIVLETQGQLSRARQIKEQVLAERRELLGDDHDDTLKSVHNLSIVMIKQGEVLQAWRLHLPLLRTRCRLLGAAHADTLKSARFIARLLRDAGYRQRASAMDLCIRRITSDGNPVSDATELAGLAETLSGLDPYTSGLRRLVGKGHRFARRAFVAVLEVVFRV